MKTKLITSLVLTVFTLMLLTGAVSATTLSTWALTTNNLATGVDINMAVTNFVATGTLSHDPIKGASSNDAWNISAPGSVYYSFNVTPNSGYLTSLSGLSFSYMKSNDTTATGSFQLQYSKSASFTSPVTIVTKTDAKNTSTDYSSTALNIQANPGETIYFRVYGYNFVDANDKFYVKNLKVEGQSIQRYCSNTASSTDLKLEVEVTNEVGDKDDIWRPLDTVTVEVKFKNDKDKDLDENDLSDVMFALGLFKKGTTIDVAEDLQWISEDENEVEVGDVDAGDDYTHVFEFKINPSDIDSGDYLLMVKAYPDGDEDAYCIDSSSDLSSTYYQEISVEGESDKDKVVIVDVDSLEQPVEALCGEEVSLTVDVWNIGQDDFDDDQVKVVLINTELGLNLEQTVDVGAGDKEEVTFTFTVPKGAEETEYDLMLQTFYDYDEDDEEYDRESEEQFPVQLKVEGGCVFDPKLTTSADLTSGGKAGQEMVVKVTVTNTDSVTRTFTVGSSAYDTWAKLVKFSPETLTIAAGESAEVELTFLVNSDVEGTKTFSLDLTNENDKVIPQPVEVLVEKAGFSLFPGTGAIVGGKNWYIWAIGALNIVLVLIIILVAVRLVKK
jgi:hypothetical protein